MVAAAAAAAVVVAEWVNDIVCVGVIAMVR